MQKWAAEQKETKDKSFLQEYSEYLTKQYTNFIYLLIEWLRIDVSDIHNISVSESKDNTNIICGLDDFSFFC